VGQGGWESCSPVAMALPFQAFESHALVTLAKAESGR